VISKCVIRWRKKILSVKVKKLIKRRREITFHILFSDLLIAERKDVNYYYLIQKCPLAEEFGKRYCKIF